MSGSRSPTPNYEEGGLEGLRERSRRPHVSPNATKAEVVGKILYLRRPYHFGPHKISIYLKRYHDIQARASNSLESSWVHSCVVMFRVMLDVPGSPEL
jgi:hypothetical protein